MKELTLLPLCLPPLTRSSTPGQRRWMRRGPAVLESLVPVLQPCRGWRRRADCSVEPSPMWKRPRGSTEERSGPAGRGSPATTPCGPSAWTSVPEDSLAARTIMPAAEPDAAEWEPEDDFLTSEPGSSQSWTASEPELRQVLCFTFLLHLLEHFCLSQGEMSRVQLPAASELISPGSGAAGDPDPGFSLFCESSPRVAGEGLLSPAAPEVPVSGLEVESGATPTQSGSVGLVPEAQSGSTVGLVPEAQSGSTVGLVPEAQSGSTVGSVPEAQSGSDVGAAPAGPRFGEEAADPRPPDAGQARFPRHPHLHRHPPHLPEECYPSPPGAAGVPNAPPGSPSSLPFSAGPPAASSQRFWWAGVAGRPPEGLSRRFGSLGQPPDLFVFLCGDLLRPPETLYSRAWDWGRPPELSSFPLPVLWPFDAGRPPEPFAPIPPGQDCTLPGFLISSVGLLGCAGGGGGIDLCFCGSLCCFWVWCFFSSTLCRFVFAKRYTAYFDFVLVTHVLGIMFFFPLPL
ncbi:uncharacterized protein KZ484_007907 isoform 1-T1 [Pholidichthys leucotaenia]